ncbi:MAG: hypothetical protein ABEJ00_00990, partial [Gemmatimonadota bacterium]
VLSRPDGKEVRLEIDQKYQEIRASLDGAGPGGTDVGDPELVGDSITFVLGTVRYSGTVSGDGMQGSTGDGRTWSARRTSGAGQS